MAPLPENEIKKVFKLVNLKDEKEGLSADQVEKRANKAIERFRKENPEIDPTKKIYAVIGYAYQDL